MENMSDKTIQERMISKLKTIKNSCIYGLTHFCDGTPNMSAKGVDANVKPKERCPNYFKCEIRQRSVFAERGNDE